MILYTVKYKLSNQLFWRRIKNIKGDGLVETNKTRFFILRDETRIEIPISACFIFSKERYSLILERSSKEAGQDIKIDKR